ncbi:Mth938-like domain-containing protein [Chloroflexota bacterium]
MIDSYRFGKISIEGRNYTSDVIILPDGVISWWRKQGHNLDPADLDEVISARPPEVVVIGIGEQSMMVVPESTKNWLEDKGISVVIADTGKACETYNRICDSRNVIAALHLTC